MVEVRGRWRRFGRLAMVFTAALALGGGRAAGAQQVNMKVLYRFDFGDDYQQVAPGYQPVSRVYRSARFLWVGPVNDDERADNPDPLLRDFETGNRGEFRMGLDNGEYRITVIMSDSAQAHGPFTIYVQDEAAASDIRLAPGQVVRRTIAGADNCPFSQITAPVSSCSSDLFVRRRCSSHAIQSQKPSPVVQDTVTISIPG